MINRIIELLKDTRWIRRLRPPLTTEMERLDQRLKAMREKGLSDIKWSPGDLDGATPETVAAEMNRWLDAIEAGEGRPLKFNDSQRRQDPDTGGFATVDQLIGYCEEHCKAPMPKFSGRQLNALLKAAFENPDGYLSAEPDHWYTPSYDEIMNLCKLARRRQDASPAA